VRQFGDLISSTLIQWVVEVAAFQRPNARD
jgi:hypothetical protein